MKKNMSCSLLCSGSGIRRKRVRESQLQIHHARLWNTVFSPLANGLRRDTKDFSQLCISAEAVNYKGVNMFHADHCNHSCTPTANHSCIKKCNDGYNMENTLASRIKAIRLASGDSPAVTGEKVGVSRQGYQKWEDGATENMKLVNLMRFCDKYKVNIEQLLRGVTITPNRNQPEPPIFYSKYPKLTVLKAHEPDADEQEIIEGFRVAESGLRRGMLALARESLSYFMQRNEKND